MHGPQLGRKTRAVLKRAFQKGEMPAVRLLMWTAIVVVLLTLAGVTQPFEDQLRMARNHFRQHKASGGVVLVSVNDKSVREIGRWPWPRRYQAQMIDRLTAAGAKQVYFDITFENRSNPADDALLASAIERSGRVTLPVRGVSGPDGNTQQAPGPMPMFSRHSNLASIAITYNFQNAVWHLPYSVDANGRRLPSVAASMAGTPIRDGDPTDADQTKKRRRPVDDDGRRRTQPCSGSAGDPRAGDVAADLAREEVRRESTNQVGAHRAPDRDIDVG